MLLRLLYLFALSYLFFVVLNLVLSWIKRQGRPLPRGRRPEGEEMVLDPQCQSYFPKGDAISRGGYYFCSEECAKIYLEKRTR